jgi:hypothetical protein
MHTGLSGGSDTGLASLNHQGVHSAHGNLEDDIAKFKDWTMSLEQFQYIWRKTIPHI